MTTLEIIVYVGIFVFSCTGALKARVVHMDFFGGMVMALVMAFGGGSVRDILMGNRVRWLNDNISFILVLGATLSVFLFKRRVIKYRKLIFFMDAIGLGLYTVVGIEVALENHINPPYAVLLGVVTSTFGGLVADVISNTVPSLLKKGELYATASTIGGMIYVTAPLLGIDNNTNMLLCIVFVVLVRIISKWKKLMLPEM
ncbi:MULTISPECIES: trimeric intracellular cation channel family protein [Chitinophagaceae]